MIIQVYEADEFLAGWCSEQRIIYFELNKGEGHLCNSFEEFVKECMLYEVRFDSAFRPILKNIYDLKKEVESAYKTEVRPFSNGDFSVNKEWLQSRLHDSLAYHKMDLPENIIKCVSIYEQTWDYLFLAIECEAMFYCFNWSTSA